MTKNFHFISYFRNRASYDCDFWYTCGNSGFALQIFEVFVPILLNVNLSLNQTLLTFFCETDLDYWQFLCEGLPSFNPKRFYYSYTWSCSLCERRTLFSMGRISIKPCGFLLIFLTSFTLFSVFFFLN